MIYKNQPKEKKTVYYWFMCSLLSLQDTRWRNHLDRLILNNQNNNKNVKKKEKHDENFSAWKNFIYNHHLIFIIIITFIYQWLSVIVLCMGVWMRKNRAKYLCNCQLFKWRFPWLPTPNERGFILLNNEWMNDDDIRCRSNESIYRYLWILLKYAYTHTRGLSFCFFFVCLFLFQNHNYIYYYYFIIIIMLFVWIVDRH